IDWNVTARAGHPYVKVFDEERELTVMLLVDVSSSGNFGTHEQMKGDIAAEICALLAFSAIKNNDKVGLIIFTDRIEKFVPPKKGRSHVLRVLREILYHKPEGTGTNIAAALEYLNRVIRRKAVVFLVSDFLSEGYEKALRVASKRHDLVAIPVTDPREMDIPNVGFVELEDAETGEIHLLDTSNAANRQAFAKEAARRGLLREKALRATNVDPVEIRTNQPYIEPLVRFFKMRAKRFR
ncbi:DUF58 domain-containing protein, partial [Cytophagia bacterium CHB2]|nr:DUF58 domain-containing protein [Cytophagia bacterium CHB2]